LKKSIIDSLFTVSDLLKIGCDKFCKFIAPVRLILVLLAVVGTALLNCMLKNILERQTYGRLSVENTTYICIIIFFKKIIINNILL
jgi:hypothetical protein